MKKTDTETCPAGGDWIHLRQLEMQCELGVHPAERGKSRPIRMDISLECDTRAAASSDSLADALNYEMIEAEAVAVAKKGHFHLIEALAENVAKACLKYPQVAAVRVVVEKHGALPLTRSVAVEIVRRK
jgi:7,8-dihydroneopterin aldolase/epimerase/oxygenase